MEVEMLVNRISIALGRQVDKSTGRQVDKSVLIKYINGYVGKVQAKIQGVSA